MESNRLPLITLVVFIFSVLVLGLVNLASPLQAAPQEGSKFSCRWKDDNTCRSDSYVKYKCEAGYVDDCLSITDAKTCRDTEQSPGSCLYLGGTYNCYWKDNNTCGGVIYGGNCLSGYETKICSSVKNKDTCNNLEKIPCPGTQPKPSQPPGGNPPPPGTNPPGGTKPPEGTNPLNLSINNPLQFGTIPDILNAISGFLYALALAFVTIMVLWGGFQILTAAGSPAQIEKGKQTLLWAVIGTVVILIAGGIAGVIKDILGGPA